MKNKNVGFRIENKYFHLLKEVAKDLDETVSKFVYKAILERLQRLDYMPKKKN